MNQGQKGQSMSAHDTGLRRDETLKKANQCEALRIHRGLTRLEVCRLSGLSYTAIKNFESGKKVPRVQTLKGLSKAYGLPIKQVLDVWNRTWVAGRWVTKHGLEKPGGRMKLGPMDAA